MISTLEHSRTLLQQADPKLQELVPLRYEGLYLGSSDTTDPLLAQIVARYPNLLQPCMVAGKLGETPDTPSLFIRRSAEHLFEATPALLVWPALVPTLSSESLLNRPQVIITPGSYVYLRVSWAISTNAIASSGAQIIISRSSDLMAGNDMSPIATTDSRTWYHLIGTFAPTTGDWTPANTPDNPFVPEALLAL
jgi:hypothetical protein